MTAALSCGIPCYHARLSELSRFAVLPLVVLAAACARPEPYVDPVERRAGYRAALFAHMPLVKLSNCEFERVGDKHDGGYVICKNLVGRAESLYSYGISATDNWGCTLSARLKRPVHQYDCFNTDRPPCEGATPLFHEECVGPKRETLEGRLFDTVDAQIARNGDTGKRLVMKMDVEGAEWPSLLSMSDAVLQQIDQLSVEFHGVEEGHYADTMKHLAALLSRGQHPLQQLDVQSGRQAVSGDDVRAAVREQECRRRGAGRHSGDPQSARFTEQLDAARLSGCPESRPPVAP